MLRRTVSFVAAIAIIGGVASLVYFNSQPTTLRWAPNRELTVPLAWLIVGATTAGAALGLVVLLAREGHWALRQWRLLRALRASERAASRRSEARASLLAGRHAQARSLLAKTASGPSAVIDDAVDYGEAFLAEGRPTEGRTHLEDARKELGDDPRILFALARCCRALGDDAAAVAALDRAVDALPSSVALHSLRRDCLVDLQWWPTAEAAQQRIVDLHPSDPSEKHRLIDIRMKAAEFAGNGDREAALRGVLALDPSWPAAATARAAMLAERGQNRAALRILVRAAKRRPAEETLRALDEMLEKGSPRKMLSVYRKLRRGNPASSELVLHLAANLVRLGRHGEAEAQLRELEGATGREAALVESLRARILESHSDSAGAADALRRALDSSLEG
ncbi:MAG TPA: tetratricopeptide repeat protein [Candidatus Binatia bacterium]|jgi:predicted Zn-dependent protease